jgi:methylglutamate dehydrogenase subunit D
VTFTGLRDFELLQIMARRGKWSALAKAAKEQFGTTAPAKPKAMAAGDTTLIWSGPDQFLALAPRKAGSPLHDASAKSLAGIASISDQSDGRALIRIAGPKARDVLAKFCSLDLDPSEFPVGAAAVTSIDHTAATLWRGKDEDGAPVFFLLVFTSFAESLWHMMLDAGAEFGVEVGEASFGG